MTLEEVSQVCYIKREIGVLQAELQELEKGRKYHKTAILLGTPRGKDEDMSQDYITKEKQLKAILLRSLIRLQEERRKLEKFVASIEDSEIRLIIRLRCVNGMDWEDIGNEIGIDRTTASIKFRLYFKNLLPE